ncbi:MAG TPA: M20/M25/M40 family metallo-hydrolase, partial [Candidatus Bathyarchaeota archaeon]|nr:M20/M25/M40 family metallo-hydrolase [Candidatus Bathyarchaeota archaeon]
HRIWHEYDRTVNISVDMVLVRDSCEVPRNEEVVKALLKAVEAITGKKLDVSGSRAVGDLSIIYKEGGIPAVCYGPTTRTDKTAHSDMESVSIENLETISKVYSTLALSFCGVKG